MQSINFIEEEECPKHSASSDIPDFRDIYHGCMSREVSVKTLRASGRDKCYLVRKRINAEENSDSVEFILSFVHRDEDYHFKIKKENKYFIFANRYFPSFKCVISHYMVSNIISDAHLEFGVVNRTISAVRESLRGQRCYLSENVSDERMKELLCNDHAGSYLFRPRTDDNNQFVLMFFDGSRIHKLKMDVRLLDRNVEIGDEEQRPDPAVVIVLGRNFFESWREMVDNFSVNPIVGLKDASCEDKLVKEVDVNRNVNQSEQEDIYRKFNKALQQTNVYSIHGEVSFSEGVKVKWKPAYAYVDKDHGHLILKTPSKTSIPVIVLSRCKFIPVHHSVHQRYSFLLLVKDAGCPCKQYLFSMTEVAAAPCASSSLSSSSSSPQQPAAAAATDSRNRDQQQQPEETYAYRQYNLGEHDKEVYHCTEPEPNTEILLCRAYDRWTVAVKRHCSNTKDDAANEENPERHSKLHRYNRRLKLQIGHSGGQEISLIDSDLSAIPCLGNTSSQHGQFEVMVGHNVIRTVPRKPDSGTQTIFFQDLPSNIDDVSVSIRVKGSKRKEFFKELCTYTIAHPELVPRQCAHAPPLPPPCHMQQVADQSYSSLAVSSSLTTIQVDPPSSCGPFSVDCYASIEYKELVILPFNNYQPLSKCLMENLRSIFSNQLFFSSFTCASEMPEFKKLLNCFLYMAIWEKKQVDFLYFFFEKDLKASEPSLYFRQNTLASKLFLDYVFQFASNWLTCSFVLFFEEIYNHYDLLESAELVVEEASDPSEKQYSPDTTIFKCLEAALSGISQNLEHCPLTLRQLFYKMQCDIKSHNPTTTEVEDGLNYRLLTNLVMLRFFCAVLNSRGERQNEFFRKISDSIKKKNDQKFKDFPKIFAHSEKLNEFLVKISRLILQTYSASKCGASITSTTTTKPPSVVIDDLNLLIRDHRDRNLQSINDDLTRTLNKAETEKVAGQLDAESKAICRLSLSRRFNDVLEFLSRMQEEPTSFLARSPGDGGLTRLHLIPQDLGAIVDDINQKKNCGNTSQVERL